MKFRLIWAGSDDGPEKNEEERARAAAILRENFAATGYGIRGMEMVRYGRDANRKITPLANFIARIVSDVVLDDGAAQNREFVIEVELAAHRLSLQIPAVEFGRMAWVLNRLGPQAILYPGQQQHARAAIQSLSSEIRHERIFTHMGWRRHASDWVHLQGGGALGAKGLRPDVRVQLPPELRRYRTPPVADSAAQISAIRASLRFLSVAPDRISLPLLAAVYRAPLGKVDFSLFLSGPSGSFKTALAALCQQHFGAEMDARDLPGHFGSTGNALEELAFRAKDALLVVDDFVPTEGDGRMQDTAERLFRAAGNHQGRSRLAGHGRLRPSRPPRALVLATGEEVPRGRSLRARLLIVELRQGDVDRSVLGECQTAASRGELAGAMAGFLSWIAERYEDLQQRLLNGLREMRRTGLSFGSHPRLPTTLAELQTGWEIWLRFALDAGAITEQDFADLGVRCTRAMAELVALQVPYQAAGSSAEGMNQTSRLAGGSAAPTKKSEVIAMLDREDGATLDEIAAATGWQKHTVSGFLSGTVAGRLGINLSSFRRDGARAYRIDRPE
jgi:hypothetical protein